MSRQQEAPAAYRQQQEMQRQYQQQMNQQQQQQKSAPRDELDEEELAYQREMRGGAGGAGGGLVEPEVTLRDILVYTLRNYVFSLIGDMSSKLFVAPLERLNVLHQTNAEIAHCGISRNLGGILQGPKTIFNYNLGGTIWSGLVMQFWRTTLRSFTSSAFYICEPMAGSVIVSPTYFYYIRPVVIDLLNLLCVYPIDTAATISMADEPDQPLYPSTFSLVKRVLSRPTDSLRGFTITALGLVAYRGMLSGISNFLMTRDLIPHGIFNRFLLQNAVLFACTALVYPFDTIRRRLIVHNAFSHALSSRKRTAVLEDSANSTTTTTTATTTVGGGAAAATSTNTNNATNSTTNAAQNNNNNNNNSHQHCNHDCEVQNQGTRAIIKRIYREEGIGGFFNGLSLRMLRMCGGAAFYGLIQYMEMMAARSE